MVVLHIIATTNPAGNGVYTAVNEYIKYEKLYGDVALYSLRNYKDVNDYTIFAAEKYKSIDELDKPFNKPDIVVFNEIYKKEYLSLYKECLKKNIPYVVIPHGSLTKQAQNQKKLKKTIGNILFNKFLKNASAIQFLNEYERDCSIKINEKSLISGNGIDTEIINLNEKIMLDPFRFTYIGRYSIFHKGIDILINACYSIKDFLKENNITINLYGRDSLDTKESIQNLVNEKNLNNFIKVNGPVYESEKEEVLKNTSVFIQTSRFEGHPMGVIEALAYGIPCLVTYETTLGSFVNSNRCGISVNANVDDISEAIKTIYNNKDKFEEYRKNAIDYTKEIFDWKKIAKDCINKYDNLVKEK